MAAWMPVLAAVAVCAVTLLAWQALRARDDESIRAWSEIQSRAAVAAIQERKRLFELAFLRMARRQELEPRLAAWRGDAARYLEGFPALEGIVWERGEGGESVSEPPGIEDACRPAAGERDELFAALERARAMGGLLWAADRPGSETIALCAYAPLEGATGRQYLAAVLSPQTTLGAFLPSEDDGLLYEIEMQGELVYRRGAEEELGPLSARQPLRVGEVGFEVRAAPSRQRQQELRPATASLVLVAGLLIAMLLGLALESTRRARLRSLALAAANRRLATEIERRRSAEQQLEREAVRLRVTAGQLERSNEDLKDFASVVSHDLRTPLRGIGNLAAWLAEDQGDRLDPEGRSFLDRIRTRVGRLDELIDAVLQVARLSQEENTGEWVSLEDLVRRAVSLLDVGDAVEIKIEGDMPSVPCRPGQIALLFQNLIANAIRYCDDPVPRVTIASTEEAGAWRVSVTDNGPGIDPQYHGLVFQMFQRLDPKSSPSGTGVGLALARKIVLGHGGQIGVDSQPGHGACFWFTLPKQGLG